MQTFTFKRVKRHQEADEQLKMFGQQPIVSEAKFSRAALYDLSTPQRRRARLLVSSNLTENEESIELTPKSARELARRLLTFADEGEA